MTIYRARVLDTPDDPFHGGTLRSDTDAGLAVADGTIIDRGPFADVLARHRDDDVVDLRDGVLLPGLVDAHVHFPQVRIIGGLGMPLLDWLDRCALPEEARMVDVEYARGVAAEFVTSLLEAGTTTALVFGAHFAPAVDVMFEAAEAAGPRITSGLVVSDRLLHPQLHTTPQRAFDEGAQLAARWHGRGRARYAVIPRFALSCSDPMLAACQALHDSLQGSWFTTHVNENPAEIAKVRELFGCDYLDSYHKHGLVGPRSVFAHNVHPTDAELGLLGTTGGAVAHCPTSNASLGSGLFPLGRHLDRGVPVALGSDVGAGTGFSLFKEGLQAYFAQRLRIEDGVPLTSAHLLHMATSAGAKALGLDDQIGDLGTGKRFDAIWLRPAPASTLDIALRHATDPDDALAKIFTHTTRHDIANVWVDGTLVR